MTDFALQRANMVESQVRPSDMADRRVVRAMAQVPRERFVPPSLRALAYMDAPVRVGSDDDGRHGRFLLAPRTFARMVQLLELGPSDIVLDIGCATGYSTAVLARIAQTVVALEQDKALADRAQVIMNELQIDNAAILQGSLVNGIASEGPYDAILINGAVSEVPPALLDQLKDGGRLVAIRIENGVGRAVQWRRMAMRFDSRVAFDANATLLPGFEPKVAFEL